MCKICGQIVTKAEAKEVLIGGRSRKLCESCVGKKVPAMAAPYIPG